MVKACGVKLSELHIGNGYTRPVSHCHSITRRYVRISSIKVNLSTTPGCQNNMRSTEGFHYSIYTIEYIRPNTPILSIVFKFSCSNEVDCKVILKNRYTGRPFQRCQKRTHHFPARRIFRMQHPSFGVPPFLTQ